MPSFIGFGKRFGFATTKNIFTKLPKDGVGYQNV